MRLKLLRTTDKEFAGAMSGLRSIQEFNAELRVASSEMIRVMCHERGVGLAGPQVGLPLRLIVFNAGLDGGFHNAAHDVRMANPEIASRSDEETTEDESSLSMRGVPFAKVRPKWVQARWSDVRTGEVRERRLEGRAARIFCHLLDTLNGEFFPREAESTR